MTSALRDAVQTIGNTIVDLSELKVQTIIGDVNLILDKKKLVDLESLLKPAGAEATAQARLHLVLDTTIKFDGDSINFIDPQKVSPELIELHKGAVTTGLLQRQGLVEMFKGLIL
ncbi:MAG: hypothetical protein HUK40_11580 [Desulfobacter sp.]|nr:hypothetical protein [Desulfobacter sp.]WDP84460.1 MAG: hypothetical protein HUN05_04270 [Desulfobacter sp.]